MGFKLILEQKDDSAEEYPCPKCGEDVETEDNYCCNCGTKLPKAPEGKAGARLNAMKNMAMSEGTED